jgi:uncharacterized protein YaiI (UPF0178 family)
MEDDMKKIFTLAAALAIAAALLLALALTADVALAQSMPSFYVSVNNRQAGPFNQNQLQQMIQRRDLTRDTLVWTDGMAEWTPAGKVRDF